MTKATEDAPTEIRIWRSISTNKGSCTPYETTAVRLLIFFLFLCAHECAAQVLTYTTIRQVDFRNFTYHIKGFLERPSDFRLRDGSYVEKEHGLITYSVKLMTVAYGDVTGDGEEDAAVVLIVSGGGSGFVTEGTVYTLRHGRAAALSTFEGGEGGRADSVQSISMALDRLSVVYVNRSGSTHTIDYRWDGQRFVPIRRGEQTNSSPGLRPREEGTAKYFVRLFNCDDSCIARINDQDIGSTGFNADSGWLQLDNRIEPGVNRIKFLVFNIRGAIAYGFQVRKNETVVFEKVCGQAGRYGCENDRVFANNSLARTFSYDLITPPQASGSIPPSTNNKPLIGSVSKEHLADGCGCSYQLTNDSSRTIYSSDFETVWMNIDGKDIKLNRISSTSLPQGRVRKGQRTTIVYTAPGITVTIESMVTKASSENYEGSDYTGTIKVDKGGRQERVSFTGFCGC